MHSLWARLAAWVRACGLAEVRCAACGRPCEGHAATLPDVPYGGQSAAPSRPAEFPFRAPALCPACAAALAPRR
ncbi:ComF family protein, partial [Desulfovibrio oxamicus]|nr:ComF family protein [Nitratidesulfovibrio oxamicus]